MRCENKYSEAVQMMNVTYFEYYYTAMIQREVQETINESIKSHGKHDTHD